MSGPVTTLARLMSVWQRPIEQIERKQDMGYEDYEQALIARDYLEEAVALLSPDVRDGLVVPLRRPDQGFATVTRPLATSIRPLASWEPQPWWWFRVPLPMGESFQARLEHVAPAAAHEAHSVQEDPPSEGGREVPG